MKRIFLLFFLISAAVSAEERMKESHKKQFDAAVESGEIEKLCRNHPSSRIPFFTITGDWFRETHSCKNWKLQQHNLTGNWRIADPEGNLRAEGKDMHHLEEFFRNHPVTLSENRKLPGNRFYRYPGTNGETVILIHGWNVRASYVSRLAVFLQSNGYSVLNYDYATNTLNVKEHAAQFLKLFRSEKVKGKIHFVVHSMGGLVIRHVLSGMTEAECRQIDTVVMLAPANQGSELAGIGKMVYRKDKSIGDMIPGAEAQNIPLPSYYPPVGIIAAKHDGKVSYKRTAIPGNVSFQRTTVKSNHPDMRLPKISGETILKFIRDKKF